MRQAGGPSGSVKLKLLTEARAEFQTQSAVKIIRDVLALIRNKQLEVPYIATYARDVYDTNDSATDLFGDISAGFKTSHLWLIWMYDEKVRLIHSNHNTILLKFTEITNVLNSLL